jgi:hypothetical protein
MFFDKWAHQFARIVSVQRSPNSGKELAVNGARPISAAFARERPLDVLFNIHGCRSIQHEPFIAEHLCVAVLRAGLLLMFIPYKLSYSFYRD